MDAFLETDRLRFEFLTAELELSLTFARFARFQLDNGQQEHGQRLLDNAAKGCEVVRNLLADPRHSIRLSDDQVHYVDQKLGHLREEIAAAGKASAIAGRLGERPASVSDLRQKNAKRGAAAEFARRPHAPAELADHG